MVADRGRPASLVAGAAVSPAGSGGNLGGLLTSASHVGYNLTLLQGKMMGHRGDSIRKGCPGKPPIRTSPRRFHLDHFFTLFAIQF